jgi:hypothetical protein
MDKRKQPHTEEHKRKISEAQKALGALHWSKRPEVIAKRVASMAKKWADPEYKRMHSEAMKKRSTPEFLERLSLSHKGQHSSPATEFVATGRHAESLLGGRNAYRAIHKWVQRKLGAPSTCSKCNITATGKQMHWANRSGEYKRDLHDWVRLCAKCHYEQDINRQVRVRMLTTNNTY